MLTWLVDGVLLGKLPLVSDLQSHKFKEIVKGQVDTSITLCLTLFSCACLRLNLRRTWAEITVSYCLSAVVFCYYPWKAVLKGRNDLLGVRVIVELLLLMRYTSLLNLQIIVIILIILTFAQFALLRFTFIIEDLQAFLLKQGSTFSLRLLLFLNYKSCAVFLFEHLHDHPVVKVARGLPILILHWLLDSFDVGSYLPVKYSFDFLLG